MSGTAMNRRLILAFAAGSALTVCCPGSGCYGQDWTVAMPSSNAVGTIPMRGDVEPANVKESGAPVITDDETPNEDELTKLKPYSKEWWSVRDSLDRAADADLSKKIIICQGCTATAPGDQADAATPNS